MLIASRKTFNSYLTLNWVEQSLNKAWKSIERMNRYLPDRFRLVQHRPSCSQKHKDLEWEKGSCKMIPSQPQFHFPLRLPLWSRWHLSREWFWSCGQCGIYRSNENKTVKKQLINISYISLLVLDFSDIEGWGINSSLF